MFLKSGLILVCLYIHLIKVAEEFMTDNISKNICQQFKTKGYISYKQRRYLVYNLLHCAEDSGKWVIKSV